MYGDLPIGDAAVWGGFIATVVAAVVFAPQVSVAIWRRLKGITFRDVLLLVFVLLILAVAWTAAGIVWASDFVRGRP